MKLHYYASVIDVNCSQAVNNPADCADSIMQKTRRRTKRLGRSNRRELTKIRKRTRDHSDETPLS